MRCLLFFAIFLISSGLHAQFSLTGKVLDEEALPLEGANIIIPGTSYATVSDDSGTFIFEKISQAEVTIKVSYIGFKTTTVKIDLREQTEVTVDLQPSVLMTDEVIVSATRAIESNPTTFINVSKEEINRKNLGQDLPFQLEHTPSAVVSSDAGAGVGYTGIRIRGTDPTRINVTLNGIPLNDSESQGVFWVNLPDFASSVDNIQIQRGVGNSTNGASAFGASINIQTTSLTREPYVELSNSAGSFKTFKHSLNFGTGLIKDRFSLDGRVSKISSDGYIDRASSDLRSLFLSAAYYDENTIIRGNIMLGKEITYQAWYGVPESELDSNRTFNLAGTDFGAKEEPYDNEVDDYRQDHYQLLLSQQLSDNWLLNTGLHYTRGRGFFEQYKVGQSFESYNLLPVMIGGDTVSSTDLIRQRWLDNDFYGATFSLSYELDNQLTSTLGGAWNQYDGDHFGEIIWAQFASNGEINERFYDNNGLKTDFNIYWKTDYRFLSKWTAYLDLQYRNVGYSVKGVDIDQRDLFVDDDLHFFNPKIGLSYLVSRNISAYASFGIGNKEPSRNDYIDAPGGRIPEPETLRNLEAGVKWNSESHSLSVNYYLMDYKNQLVLTGALNDVGSAIRTNVNNSYRTGIELDGKVRLFSKMDLSASVTYSINKIRNFTEFINTYDENYTPIPSLTLTNQYENTDIAFSPDLIASAILTYRPVNGLQIDLLNKYVGEQYLDNTSNDSRQLDDFFVNDLVIGYSFEGIHMKEIEVKLLLNNITNRLYEPNGYTFTERYTDSEANPSFLTDPVTYNYYYPQAGFNVMAGLTLKF